MTIGADKSYSGQSKIYRKQQPAGTTINGGTVVTEEVVDNGGGLLNIIGAIAINSAPVAMYATVVIAPNGVANKCDVTFTITDGNGNAITGVPFTADVFLSDAATGVGLTATTASGGVAVKTGTQLQAMVAAKALYVQSDTNGVVAITITDTGKTGFFVALCVDGFMLPVVSRQLVAGDYT